MEKGRVRKGWGVAYIALGPSRFRTEALNSLYSLRRRMPDIRAVLFTDAKNYPKPTAFDEIIGVENSMAGCSLRRIPWKKPGWLTRIEAFARPPFERTLFIDSDTEVVGDIGGVFDVLDRFEIAAAHAPYRYRAQIDGIPDSFPEFNCGVVCIRKSAAVEDFVQRWRAFYLAERPHWDNDQHSFRRAAWESKARIAVLPPEFNLRPLRHAGLDAPRILHGFHRGETSSEAASRRVRFLSDDHGGWHHRAGWKYAVGALRPLTHPKGIVLDTMIENTYGWHLPRYRDVLPMREPWIGIAHVPQRVPAGHFDQARPQRLMTDPRFTASLAGCLGFFVLSEYHAGWLRAEVGKPVEVLYHPVDFDVPQFDFDALKGASPRPVVHVGWWLRRLESFNRLNATGYVKQVLKLSDRNAEACLKRISWHDDIQFTDYLPDSAYDRLLSRAVVFADLIDTSANNVVVDCIARGTPLVVNRHPALEEYLSPDYPLFYESLEEAADFLHDDDALLRASIHLRQPALRSKLSASAFRQSLVQSRIYRSLPSC